MTIRTRLGLSGEGTPLTLDWSMPTHIAAQGGTRSGKSVWASATLAQLARKNNVLVTGIDPTGVLLAPWRAHPRPDLRHTGTRDMSTARATMRRLVDEMDRRIEQLLVSGRDKIETFSQDTPLVIVVLDEWPGALVADEESRKAARSDAPGLSGIPLRTGFRRLTQESAKVGFRVVAIAQRMDASIIGGAERSNLSTRLSFRVDNADAVRMLHPDAESELIAEVATFPTGVGILQRPGEKCIPFLSEYIAYEEYARQVRDSAGLESDGGGSIERAH